MQRKPGPGLSAERVHKKRLYDIDWTDSKNCTCCEADGTEKRRIYHCREWREERNKIPRVVRTCEMKAKSSQNDWKWQRGLVSYPEMEGIWQAASLESSIGFRRHHGPGTEEFKASAIIWLLMVLCKGSRGKMRRVVGQWCMTMTRKKRRGMLLMVRCWRSWKCREQLKEQIFWAFSMGALGSCWPIFIFSDSCEHSVWELMSWRKVEQKLTRTNGGLGKT